MIPFIKSLGPVLTSDLHARTKIEDVLPGPMPKLDNSRQSQSVIDAQLNPQLSEALGLFGEILKRHFDKQWMKSPDR
jgi:hypothetical protein